MVSLSSFTAAWQNEIMAISPATGNVSRFAHTFITARSHRFDACLTGQPSLLWKGICL
jgi:hypothetical protein